MATNQSQPRFGCYVGNIDRSVTLEMLKQVFCQCGTIVDCSLNGREEDPYRYGFIDFASEDDRSRAMKYNGFTLVGRKLKVGVSKGNVNKPEGFTTGGGNASNSGNGGNAQAANQGNNRAPVNTGNTNNAMNPMNNMGSGMMPNNMMAAQQMQAQLLLQLVQQGSMDPRTLTPEQQQLLMNFLTQGNGAAAPVMAPMPQPTMPPMGAYPQVMPQQMWNGGMMRGAYPIPPQASGPVGRNAAFHRGPANPAPSEETMKLREVQRKQFLDVVRKDAEKYERKHQEKIAKEEPKGGPAVSNSEESSASDEDDEKYHVEKRASVEDPAAEDLTAPDPTNN